MTFILILCTIIFTIAGIYFISSIEDNDIVESIASFAFLLIIGSVMYLIAFLLIIGSVMYLIASNISITKTYDDFVKEYSITEKTELNDSIWYTTDVVIDTTFYNVTTIVDTIK
jgi:hypothetical protein